MINNEILTYVRHQLNAGVSREQISKDLKTGGWNDDDINQAFNALNPVVPIPPPAPVPAPSPMVSQPVVSQPIVSAVAENPVAVSQPTIQPTIQPRVEPVAQPVTQPVVSNLTSNTVVQPQVVTSKSHKIWPYITIFFIIPLVVMAVLGYVGYTTVAGGISSFTNSLMSEELTGDIDFNQHRVEYVKVLDQNNGYFALAGLDSDGDFLDPVDREFITGYFDNYPNVGKLDLKQAEKILTKYKEALGVFDQAVSKSSFQCQGYVGDGECSLNTIRSLSQIAALNSLFLYNTGKVAESKIYAENIIKLGDMLVVSGNELIINMFSLVIHDIGYKTLGLVGGSSGWSEQQREAHVLGIKVFHENAIKRQYSRAIEFIEYVDDTTKPIEQSEYGFSDEDVGVFRLATKNNPYWKPYATKKLFYDTLVIDLKNLNMPCGSVYEDSRMNVSPEVEELGLEDAIGKSNPGEIMYVSTHLSYETFIKKSCEVRELIKNL